MSSIWHHMPNPSLMEKTSEGTIDQHLGIKITDVGDDYLTGTMPADQQNISTLWYRSWRCECGFG